MGAVTALLYASRMSASHRDTLPVLAIVLDSPYSNLSAVLAEIAAVRTSVPQFIVEGVIGKLPYIQVCHLKILLLIPLHTLTHSPPKREGD
jgi:hypothetical protein